MARVEIEIDDAILDAVDKAGYRLVGYGYCDVGGVYWSSTMDPSKPITSLGVKHHVLKIEPKPDDSIPFPDWVPEKWKWVAINQDGVVSAFDDEPKLVERDGQWDGWTLFLTIDGFDTSWVPPMPNNDWTKAKWRRRQ